MRINRPKNKTNSSNWAQVELATDYILMGNLLLKFGPGPRKFWLGENKSIKLKKSW